MKKDIILSGVGGQGILSIATVIGWAALKEDLHLKQAEVHGMSQRGGDVQSNLRLSSEPIFSDLIPKGECDIILSLEPMEALRYLPWLSGKGWIVTNTAPFVNIPNYPPVEDIMDEIRSVPNVVTLDCDAIARETGSPRSANMVLLGASAAVLDIIGPDRLREGIAAIFSRKGDAVVAANTAAFDAGLEVSKKFSK
ncbi:MAG: indolepyruvate oxidoreductase subunit beta [Bacteroidales bacterium]|nr:indolepyruvate oxidoreductase subunit beta [Bacteroidales bacterium]